MTRRLTVNPFVSEAQRRACYARDYPGWDCKEWESHTTKKLPKRKKKKLTRNRRLWWKKPVRNKGRKSLNIDPTRTLTLRRAFVTRLRKQFALLKGRISKLIVDEDSLGLKEPDHVPFTANCAGGVLEVPDVRQPNHYFCGACATTCVAQYLGVDTSLTSTAVELGTTVERSTHPGAIVEYFRTRGFEVYAEERMTVDDLENCISRGMPVICPVQDYGARRESGAEFEYGHYLTVIGVIDDYVVCQDSSIENLKLAEGGSVGKSEMQEQDISAPGRVMVYKSDWARVWHDKDIDGNKFIHYGIAVGRMSVANESVAGSSGTVYWEDGRPSLTYNTRWKFHADADKIDAFQDWLRSQFDSTLRSKSEEQLWRLYIERGFQKGAGRSFDDVNKKLKNRAETTPDFYAGSKDQFLRSSFAQPEAVDKVKLLTARAFDDLDGVTSDMSTRMSRALTDGLVEGRNPLDIAGDLADQLDIGQARAETIARTELIRAHAEGQLTALENMGVEEVGVAVEWEVTDDGKVCDLCSDLDGVVLKLDEARNMLPRHPNCRCCWIPANVGEDDADQKRSKAEIDEASDGYLDVGKGRPESILNAMSWVSENAFCATGPGGGVDPSCGRSSGGRLNLISVVGHVAPHLLQELKGLRKLKAKLKREGKADEAKVAQKRLFEIKREAMRARAQAPPKEAKAKEAKAPAEVPKAAGDVETNLQSGTVVSKKNLGGGCNATHIVTLEDGTKGVWKPKDGEMAGLRGNVPSGTFYKREAAAYSVAKEIGMTDLVPPTVVREIDGKVGSIQKFVPNAKIANDVPFDRSYDGPKDAARAAAFDFLLGNTDRHGGNWMVGKDDNHITLIDNGLCFPSSNKGVRSRFINVAVAGRVKVPDEVAGWDASKVRSAMKKQGLDKKSMDGAMERLKSLQNGAGKSFSDLEGIGNYRAF